MRYVKVIGIFFLGLFMCACVIGKGDLEIDIGDYENQLAAWNSQNMNDYQLYVEDRGGYYPEFVFITIKNNIPEYSVPSYWLDYNRTSTIPDYYSLVKSYENKLTEVHNKGDSSSLSLKVSFNTEYHYPNKIITKVNKNFGQYFNITLMPFEEGMLEIDIGDYENQLEAWNDQNMLDYQIKEERRQGDYSYCSSGFLRIFNIKNGNVENDIYNNYYTIPEMYAFIKAEEERIRNVYNGTYCSYLTVKYDTEYHYPVQIKSRIGHHFGEYEQWEITLTPFEDGEK